MTFTTRVCPFSCKIAQKKTLPLPLYSCNPFKSLRNSSKVYESTKLSGFALSLFSFAQTSLLAGYVVFAMEGSRQSAETCSNSKICQSCERFNFEINNTRCMLHANLSTDSNGPIFSSILSQRVERQGHCTYGYDRFKGQSSTEKVWETPATTAFAVQPKAMLSAHLRHSLTTTRSKLQPMAMGFHT